MDIKKPLAVIVEEIEKERSRNKQAELLQKYDSTQLREILEFTFHPQVSWLLPETDPPYKPLSESADQEGRFYREVMKLGYFTNTPEGLEVKQIRREQLFIQVLESIDPRDAKLLLRMKNRKLKIKPDAIKQAFPKMVANWG